MSPIYHEKSILELIKRESNDTFTNPFFDSSTGSAWIWGRWVLFGVFGILGIIIVILGTLKINRGRNKIGQAPIRGTAWMIPPSYRQSEIQYTGNTGNVVEEYVPKYTRNANNQDLGYYDERGEFHQNNDAEYIAPPTLEPTTNSSIPQPAHAIVHESSSEEFDMTRDFQRTFNNPGNNIPSWIQI